MLRRLTIKLFFLSLSPLFSSAQSISSSLPGKLSPSSQYLFYLHAGVVTLFGNNAINQSVPEWGPYEYLNILDSLRKRGFNIISENRKEGVEDSVYVKKIAGQIDTLFNAGVRPQNIVIVGASSGSDIVMHLSAAIKNDLLKYVIMGGCWPDTYKYYTALELYGHFLSIIESSDPHVTCSKIFEERTKVSSFMEIKLNTGLSHGFIYKGHKEWIDPIAKWFHETK